MTSSVAGAPPIVTTSAGQVRGKWNAPDSAAFLGIPYAEPPTGDLRFAAPVPRRGWDGVREAVEHAPTAQRRQLAEVTSIPEPSIPGDDYLTVDVFTPRPERDAKLPVYVWFHGGGFTAGSPASPWYDGRAFNRDGIVTVTVGYRLGFIGFGHLDGAVDNRGVLDWICALEWVRDNIANFGGNPDDVTIGGQSAGGGAVVLLLGCERAQSLFTKVVAHSAPESVMPLDYARDVGVRIAAACGVAPTPEAMRDVDEDALLDAQEALSAEAMKGNPTDLLGNLVARRPGLLSFAPVADGELLTEETIDSLRRGVGADKGLLIGSTANEFNAITEQAPGVANLLPAARLLRRAGVPKEAAHEYIRAHPGTRTMALLGQFLTDVTFHVPLVADCTAHKDSWAFLFAWGSPAANGQAPHCLDLPFAWDCLAEEHVALTAGPNPPQELADALHGAIAAFIKTGDPGWPRYADRHTAQVFDVPVRTVDDALPDVRALASALRVVP